MVLASGKLSTPTAPSTGVASRSSRVTDRGCRTLRPPPPQTEAPAASLSLPATVAVGLLRHVRPCIPAVMQGRGKLVCRSCRSIAAVYPAADWEHQRRQRSSCQRPRFHRWATQNWQLLSETPGGDGGVGVCGRRGSVREESGRERRGALRFVRLPSEGGFGDAISNIIAATTRTPNEPSRPDSSNRHARGCRADNIVCLHGCPNRSHLQLVCTAELT